MAITVRNRAPRITAMLLPACAVLATLTILPTVTILAAAVTSWSAAAPPNFVGLANLRALLADDSFRNAFAVSLRFVIITTMIEFTLGVVGALALDGVGERSKRALRVAFALPLLLSPVISGIVWKLSLDEQRGMFVRLFHLMGVTLAPLSSPRMAIYAVAAIDIWQWTPFVLLLLSLSLDAQRHRLQDLVRVDAIRPRALARHVWAPLLLPTMGIVMSLRVVDTLKVFDIVQTATAGGPGGASEVLSLYAYKQLIKFTNFGYAAAICLVLLALASVTWILAARIALRPRT